MAATQRELEAIERHTLELEEHVDMLLADLDEANGRIKELEETVRYLTLVSA